jgi:WD40 repeat protein
MVATAGGETAGAKTNATEALKGKVVVWRAATGEQLATLKVDKQVLLSVAFSPDGSMIATTGGNDRAVTLWDVATWKLVGRLPHPIFIESVAFDPAGKTLATFAFDNKVRLWDIAAMRQIGAGLPGPENPGVGVVCDPCSIQARFDASGNYLVALNQNGAALVWDVNPDRWKQRACAIVGRPLTRDEWEELLPDRSYQPACR